MIKLTKLTKVANAITKATGRTGLKISKHSPAILMTTGLVGFGGTIILACKGTLKLEPIIDEAQETLEKIKHANDNPLITKEKYSDKDAAGDMFITYCKTGAKVLKVYAPAIGLGVVSIGCILTSFKILKARNLALMAAYKGLDTVFSKYRERLVADVGTDKDQEYRYGIKKVTQTTAAHTDENGNKVAKTTETVNVADIDSDSQYARVFEEGSTINWCKTPGYNKMFLKSQQNFANDLLNQRGHMFLNEVYDMLGLERSKAGAIVGWVKGNADSVIDFSIFDFTATNPITDERTILLDFNVDGVVYDKI